MKDSSSLRPTGMKYAPPEAVRLRDSETASGSDCSPTGSSAKSACQTTGNLAQACLTGLTTGGNGACTLGHHAGNCTTGSTAFRKCHTGSSAT